MKKFSQKDIKEFRDKIIEITYKTGQNTVNTQTGAITASTENSILFLVNGIKRGIEKSIKYSNIIGIQKPEKELH